MEDFEGNLSYKLVQAKWNRFFSQVEQVGSCKG